MQGWLFVHDSTFWTEPRVKSILTSVPKVSQYWHKQLYWQTNIETNVEQISRFKTINDSCFLPFSWTCCNEFLCLKLTHEWWALFSERKIIIREIVRAGTNADIGSAVGTIPAIQSTKIILRSAIHLVHAAQFRRHFGNVRICADH